jgi:hypothetical protein
MKSSRRRAYLGFAATSAAIGLGTLVIVLSFGDARFDNALAFIGGFAETLLVALAFPRSRRHLLEPFQPEVTPKSEDVPAHSKRTVR